jgi:hypothetical protein
MNTTRQLSALGAEDLFGRRIAARLSDASDNVPHEISERLKAARMMALSKRNVLKLETASAVVSSGPAASLQMGGESFNWWSRIGAVLPLIALIAGLMTIQLVQDDFWADEIASVDSELLTDELPPTAYTDPGFTQFLRTTARD